MSRFYSIQIGSVYLTSDGTSASEKCKLSVPNVEDLLSTVTGVAIPTVAGAVLQLAPWTSGKTFEINVETLMKDVYEDLLDLIKAAQETDDDFIVAGTGDTGNFSVSVKPFPVKPFSAQKFINERISGANFKFITV